MFDTDTNGEIRDSSMCGEPMINLVTKYLPAHSHLAHIAQ